MVRRGGRRVDERRGRLRRPRSVPVAEMPRSSQGDASVPSTPNPTPAPTDYVILLFHFPFVETTACPLAFRPHAGDASVPSTPNPTPAPTDYVTFPTLFPWPKCPAPPRATQASPPPPTQPPPLRITSPFHFPFVATTVIHQLLVSIHNCPIFPHEPRLHR